MCFWNTVQEEMVNIIKKTTHTHSIWVECSIVVHVRMHVAPKYSSQRITSVGIFSLFQGVFK